MNPRTRSYFELHIAVFLFGFTAILGDLIDLSAFMIVWWRVFLSSISLFFLISFGRELLKISMKRIFQYAGIGVIVGIHWLCFYGSIKYANASVALVCYATTAFFTSFFEPIILHQKIKWFEIILGSIMIPAMYLIVESIEINMLVGVWLGLAAAITAALFACLNKKYIEDANPLSITFIELSSAWVFLSLIFPFAFSYEKFDLLPSTSLDWIYLIVLVLLCTTLAYVLSLRALKHISAFAANLVINLEPVYGILMGIFILKEHKELNLGFYVGVLMILSLLFLHPLLKRRIF